MSILFMSIMVDFLYEIVPMLHEGFFRYRSDGLCCVTNGKYSYLFAFIWGKRTGCLSENDMLEIVLSI